MKIQKVEKLNYARFRNFTWDPSLPAFSDTVNIFFGWNGSGKTTFSKFIHAIEKGNIDRSCTFKIKTDLGSLSETDAFDDLKSKTRVFNDTYVEQTLRVSSKLPYIFFAGKEAVDYSEEEKKLSDKKAELSKVVLPTSHDDVAKNTALLIKGVTGINGYRKELTGGGTYSSFDKTDFKKRIKNIKEKVTAGELASHNVLIRTDIDALKNQLVNSDRVIKNNKGIASAAKWLVDNAEAINAVLAGEPLQEHSQRIEQLEANKVAWIKEGVSLHFGLEAKHDKCIFCDSDIKNSHELLRHFSDEVVRTINSIDGYLRQIETHTTTLSQVESPTQSQTTNVNLLCAVFDTVTPILREKRNAVSIKKDPIVIDVPGITALAKVTEVDATSTAYIIESHYVAEQYDAYDVAYTEYEAALNSKNGIAEEVRVLDEQVRVLKQKAKNTHESAAALNTLFKVVFPYRKIEITDHDDGTGYVLKRDGSNCLFSSLSEGEKNFIALAYFIYSINDAQNKLAADGIVLIDDPVSSLDKQAIFQIFSILVNEIKKNPGRQYFILTHNLDFLGHLKEHFNSAIGTDKIRLLSLSATDAGCIITTIHPLLKDHRSDYYYVFSFLYKFKDACSPEDSYLMVNLLRRWLETFLEFKFSTSGDLASTLDLAYSEARKIRDREQPGNPFTADHLQMYRFINHGSHGFPDTESTDESVLTSANLRIQEAIQLVKILDPLHHEKLESKAIRV
jgi:wobble nucleotide-excising tRNase